MSSRQIIHWRRSAASSPTPWANRGILLRMDIARPLNLGNNVPKVGRPEGNTTAKALRRLRKDRPDRGTVLTSTNTRLDGISLWGISIYHESRQAKHARKPLFGETLWPKSILKLLLTRPCARGLRLSTWGNGFLCDRKRLSECLIPLTRQRK